ncbi:MAG: hypothetical protein Q8M94_04705, partial [Ignavibacteria bacterium]|nr:hypothetical protein [Ignavibacteria bacterium]
LKFQSNLTLEYAHRLIDSLNINPIDYSLNPESGPDVLYEKVMICNILFELNDFSTINFVFDLINRDSIQEVSDIVVDPLVKIMQYVPSQLENAKNILIYLVYYSNDSFTRSNALIALEKSIGIDALPIIIQSFQSDSSDVNRYYILNEYLSKYSKDIDLVGILRERLYTEPAGSLRLRIAKILLYGPGGISNYNFVKNYINNESDEMIRNAITFEVEENIPRLFYEDSTLAVIIDSLISVTGQVHNLNWLGGLTFSIELKNILTTAKTNLQAGDSLACRVQVKTFQNLVDNVYKDSLNTDPRFVTIEGWKFLYWNAQYILDRLPSSPVIPLYSTYCILATHSLKLNQYSVIVQSGDIAVNEAGLEPFLDTGYELSVGANATTPAGYKVKANRIKLNQNSVINGDIYYNQLNNSQGIINGTQTTPLELPLFTELPEFKASNPGTENITISNGQTRVLAPGSYGNVTINKNGILVLTGGTYHFNVFVGGQQSTINYQSTCEIRIAGKLDIGKLSNVVASDTTTYSSKDIVFYVSGINGTDGTL